MKYYKIVNPKGHNGLVYKEGYNEDPLPFNPSGNCKPGGIYFTDIEDILAFIDYGEDLYEIEPIGEVYENPYTPKKWKAKAVNMKRIGKIWDVKTVKYLVEQGADIHIMDEALLRDACLNSHFEVVKYLVEQGADIHILDEAPLRDACYKGHLEVVKYLIEQGADIHIEREAPLRNACIVGHFDIVKYLVEQGANIHILDEAPLRDACLFGHLEVVKYLVEHGSIITDEILYFAENRKEIYNYLIEQRNKQ